MSNVETRSFTAIRRANSVAGLLLAVLWFALTIPVWCQLPDFLKQKDAAERGDVDAQLDVAAHFEIEKNYVEAANWLRKAAGQGDSDAQSNLGYYYLAGIGVEKDYAAAVEWLRKSAAQGNGGALLLLGGCYRDARGVSKDDIQAYALLNLAASAPMSPGSVRQLKNLPPGESRYLEKLLRETNQDGVRQRDALEKLMSPQQITEAQSLTKEMRARIDATLRGGR